MEKFKHPLVQSFRDYFSISMASSDELKRQAYRIRYRVYCEDMRFEPADQFPDRLERDEFDEYSQHCLVTHKASGRAAGCMRLVNAEDGQSLPFEKHCLNSIYTDSAVNLFEQRGSVCEFSRMAVDRSFRRRPGEGHSRIGELDALDYSHRERRSFSLIGVATTLAAFAMADLSGRNRVYAMMERYLPRLLRRSGFRMEQAGEFIEYHGRRALYFTATDEVIGSLRPELRELYEAISRDFRAELNDSENVA
jgi:N-acyl amino acid synthase of PEP-CTERM/exosortase system